MNSKAIRTQLLAAVAMVLVAAVALGSSTYAWFVASGTVTATGMSVKAQSEGGLAISFDGQAWGTSATAGMTPAKSLYPASTLDLVDWYHATAADMNASDAQAGTRTKITGTVFGGTAGAFSENNYVVMKEFKIKSTATGSESKGLYVSGVDVTATKNMSTALRVGVKYTPTSGTPVYKIYGPVVLNGGVDDANKATNNYPVFKEKTTDATSETRIGTVTLNTVGKTGSTLITTSDSDATAGVIPADKPITVQIFVWFEGEDDNLKSDNFNAEDLNVTVQFSSISGPSNVATGTTSPVDLTTGVTVASTATVTIDTNSYYLITGATAHNGAQLYSDTASTLTSSSKIYTISGNVATQFTDVKLPTTT